MIRRNWRSASSIPAAVQRSRMSASCQRLTLRPTRRTISIIDSHGLVEASVVRSRSEAPRRWTVTVSARPSRSEVGELRADFRGAASATAHP